jgi:RecQ-mediated genome instability protein 1
MATAAGNVQEITAYLASKGFTPKASWVTNFLSTQRPNVPLQALQSSAMFRMIHGDITASIQITANTIFPADMLNATIKERKLKGPIPVQVLEIEDMSQSRWSQAELLEAVERGETTRGREIIRVVANENDSDQTQAPPTHGPHKLTLQDANGTQVYAFELAPMPNINLNKVMIGSKLVLRDVAVARAVVMLDPRTIVCAGGKIDDLNQRWLAGRKDKLRESARANSQQ